MKKSLFLFFLSIIQIGFSQEPNKIILSPNLNHEGVLEATNQAVLWIDSTKQKNIQDIENQAFKSLSSFVFENLSFQYFNFNFWLKLSVENPTNEKIDVLFTTGSHESTTIYRKIGNQYQEVAKTRQELSTKERPYRFDERYVKLSFLPKQHYDLRVKITEFPQLYFKIKPKFMSYSWEYEDKIRAFFDEYFYLVFDGFYVAALFFVALYVLIMYFVQHEKYYLHYSLYLFFLLIFSFWAIEHSPYMTIFHSFFPFLKFSANNNTYVLLANIFYQLFIYEFLELPKTSPRFARNVRIYIRYFLVLLLIIDTFLNFILRDYTLGSYVWLFTQLIVSLFGIYGTVEIFLMKGKLVRYIQWGTLCLLLGALVGFSEQILLKKPDDLLIMRLAPSVGFNVGVLLEIMFFSTALGYKSWVVQREKNKLIKSVKESELRTLRSQINPHFVFNSLNSIKSYILKNQSLDAAEYLTDFSTLMRSILQHSKEQLISLTDELETALLYIKLEKLRFDDDFEFIYDLDEKIVTDEVMIPPMLLQPYIENAIKHGLMNKNGSRTLRLSLQYLYNQVLIEIEDNGIGREEASKLRKNTLKHQSMGMNINDDRVKLLGVTNDFHIKVEIIDKKDENQISEGTKVMIYLPFDE